MPENVTGGRAAQIILTSPKGCTKASLLTMLGSPKTGSVVTFLGFEPSSEALPPTFEKNPFSLTLFGNTRKAQDGGGHGCRSGKSRYHILWMRNTVSMLPGSFSFAALFGHVVGGKLKGAHCKRSISLYSTAQYYCIVHLPCQERRQQGVEESRAFVRLWASEESGPCRT